MKREQLSTEQVLPEMHITRYGASFSKWEAAREALPVTLGLQPVEGWIASSPSTTALQSTESGADPVSKITSGAAVAVGQMIAAESDPSTL